jgi:hypothetical protein
VDVLNTEWDEYGDGTDYNLLPSGPGGNVPYTSAFGWGNNFDDTQTLKWNLSDSGDFFYVGHGGPTRITPVPFHWWQRFFPANPNYGISAKSLGEQLGNVVTRTNHYILHSFRLVILNSCNGYSREWANAFGFIFQANGSLYTVDDFNKLKRDPHAFVAWEPDLAAPDNTDSDNIDRYEDCLWTLMDEWQSKVPLNDCMTFYTDKLIEKNFGWVYDPKKYKISGCVDLNNSYR